MTLSQEKAITLALNILQVGFFECPRHYYEYFINNDEWALLLTAGGLNAADTPPQVLALAVLHKAVSPAVQAKPAVQPKAAGAAALVHVLSDSTGNLARHMMTAFLTQFPPDA